MTRKLAFRSLVGLMAVAGLVGCKTKPGGLTLRSIQQRLSPLDDGGIFITGHDPDYHSVVNGPTGIGPQHIIQKAIAYVSFDKANPRILLATDLRNPGGDQSDPRAGLVISGFPLFNVADYGSGTPGVLDLHTVNFSDYDAVVIASCYGGWLRQDELDVLNARSADIINYINTGNRGVVAFNEAGRRGSNDCTHDFFGYLPFVVASAQLHQGEAGDTVTPAGAAMGLTDADVSVSVSHGIFTSTGGMDIIDVDPAGHILSLATRKPISSGGVCDPIDCTKPVCQTVPQCACLTFPADCVKPECKGLVECMDTPPTATCNNAAVNADASCTGCPQSLCTGVDPDGDPVQCTASASCFTGAGPHTYTCTCTESGVSPAFLHKIGFAPNDALADWTVHAGQWSVDGSGVAHQSEQDTATVADFYKTPANTLQHNGAFADDFVIEADMGTNVGTNAGWNAVGFSFRIQDPKNFYRVIFFPSFPGGALRYERSVNGQLTEIQGDAPVNGNNDANVGFQPVQGQFYTLRLVASGSTFKTSIKNGVGETFDFTLTATDSTFAHGGIGVTNESGTGFFQNVRTAELKSASCTGTVTVVDVTPPTITCPGDETLECTNGGAVASFSATVTDNCAGATVACAPPSGSTFPLTPPGPTCGADTCTATDAANHTAQCSFKVCVQATVPPVVTTRTNVCLPEPKGADDDDEKGKDDGKKSDARTISLADCVAGVTSQCFGTLDINHVGVITRVEKVGFEDRGEHQCHPKNIVINGSSVTFSGASENGTFDLFFTVTDASGNTTAGSCEVKLVERDRQCQPKKPGKDDDGDKDDKKHKVDPDAAQDQPTCVCCVGTGCGTCPAEDDDKDEHKHHGGDDKDHHHKH